MNSNRPIYYNFKVKNNEMPRSESLDTVLAMSMACQVAAHE